MDGIQEEPYLLRRQPGSASIARRTESDRASIALEGTEGHSIVGSLDHRFPEGLVDTVNSRITWSKR